MAKRSNVYNKIYTPEKWDLVNSENKDLIQDFLTELKSQKKKETTLKQYLNDLRIIAIYVLENLDNRVFLELNKKQFRNMTLWMMDKEMSNARCNRLMSAVRSMLNFAENDDDYEYDNNVATKIKGLQKDPIRDVIFLSDEQINNLRNKLKELGKYKYMLLLDLSYDSAGRRNEIAQVMKDGLLERDYTNEVIGKRGKKFKLVYFDRTKESLALYLNQRGEDDIPDLWIIGEDNEDKANRRPASYENLYDWMMYIAGVLSELEGEQINLTNHNFRHMALENMRQGTHYVCKKLGVEKFTVEQLAVYAHHSDISTTQSYFKKDDNNVLESMFGIKLD